MMQVAVEYPYQQVDLNGTPFGFRALVPVKLSRAGHTAVGRALIDSGSGVSVLPWQLGTGLGLNWDILVHEVALGGNLGRAPARLAAIFVEILPFPAKEMLFAWSRDPTAPFILGQIDFFLNHDVCFFRSREVFSIKPVAPKTQVP